LRRLDELNLSVEDPAEVDDLKSIIATIMAMRPGVTRAVSSEMAW
jgi:hypothetical protein